MRTQRTADMASGVFLAALGLVSLFASLNIAGVTGEHLHPRTLPYFLSLVIMVAGLALFWGGWRYRGEEKPVDWPGREGWKRILIALVTMTAYLLLIETLGFTLTSFIMLAFLIWYLGHYHPLFIILFSLVTAVIIYFLFIQFLGLSFPTGPFGW